MPTFSPARRPHADPCDAVYQVYCPRCATTVAGAWVQPSPGKLPSWLTVNCGQCQSQAPGAFEPETVLAFGPYCGRTVASLTSEPELAALEQLLLRSPEAVTGALRLAVLWRLGWLDPARQQRPAGPDLEGFRRALAREQALLQKQQKQHEQQHEQQPGGQGAQDAWQARVRAEARRRQQQEQARRPPPPPPSGAEATRWVRTLGLTPPVTPQSVRRAYHHLSKSQHPDRGGSVTQMQQLNEAKAQADAWLKQQRGVED